ncbi:hypothetical protein FOIG_16936 [Fusarium odoratissimum NRRL 54006]|uniref:Uncharacterized protein n=1 Tax=Fusarium odoratissimum (strain NRRL 54006) TaxID=1089451 RepID=X0J0L2_FUSO5|nr:uncharacterized protein FOIG_16936 [Fusarium odoratissimum NRRL 54006]EXL89780.1 hypothetical protein FOIG_16936 [Fusarium odoratissimum NRRL 54006]
MKITCIGPLLFGTARWESSITSIPIYLIRRFAFLMQSWASGNSLQVLDFPLPSPTIRCQSQGSLLDGNAG